ncbi:MAG: bifunctional nicotinamidase/pyrazinamidase [Caldiserica bacterium]|nr:MAG: bifunctional nicotinamidase/pyrazinamidase [Caldisericota bacterium]
MKNALIIVDVQNDFCPGGALPVPEGDKIVPVINGISKKFFKVIATQDWHPENHISFAKTHNKNVGEVVEIDGVKQILWPVHCVEGSSGANFHKDLDLSNVDLILRKGRNPLIDSYSAFFENDKKTETGLHYYLKGLGINDVYICGLALDYCVYYTAMDSVKLGFNTYVILDATKGVDVPEGNIEKATSHMEKEGIRLIKSSDLRK